jgi:hypothetical protein
MCVADDVASTGKEKVEMLGQLPGAADVERHLAAIAGSFGELPNNSMPG